jgi:two-component system response regulator MprA
MRSRHDENVRVLVVDDEPQLRRALERALKLEGYDVELAADGDQALGSIASGPTDAIVLDVLMPKRDGLEVARELRARGDRTPILMLTARDAVQDRVDGLDAGADDYVVKPFGRQELVARVHALLRRSSGREERQETYADGLVTIDFAQRAVTFDNRAVSLTPLEFKLLAAFVRHPRQVISRDQLLDLVWGDAYGVSGDQVKLYVGYLRKKLDPDDPARVPIETVRGFGYRYRPA